MDNTETLEQFMERNRVPTLADHISDSLIKNMAKNGGVSHTLYLPVGLYNTTSAPAKDVLIAKGYCVEVETREDGFKRIKVTKA